MIDKLSRAHMALSCGADLALELPCAFSCRNAGIFANAAVDTLNATGLTDLISFGTESGGEEQNIFDEAARVLCSEPEEFKSALKKFLSGGHSFVQSRSMALDAIVPGSLRLLSSPNNNLALAYIKRITEKKYAMETLRVQRTGGGFHDKEAVPGTNASASAIRAMIARDGADSARGFIPEPCAAILRENIDGGHAVIGNERFWRAVKQTALRSSLEEMADIAEMREGLENRMTRAVYGAGSLEQFLDACTSKRYTAGRIHRYCTHLLLNLTRSKSKKFQELGPAYIRALAANDAGRELLRRMRKTAVLPVLSKPGGEMSEYAWEIMRFERAATEIWETLTDNPRRNAESLVHAEIGWSHSIT